jgi:hypothetical protein
MKVNVALAAFLVLALAVAVLAQAVDGKWLMVNGKPSKRLNAEKW